MCFQIEKSHGVEVHFAQWMRKDPNLRCIIMKFQNVRKKRKISKPSREEEKNPQAPQDVPSVKILNSKMESEKTKKQSF